MSSEHSILSINIERIASPDTIIPIEGVEYKVKYEKDPLRSELIAPDGSYLTDYGCPHTGLFSSLRMLGSENMLIAKDVGKKTSLYNKDGSVSNLFGGPKEHIDDIVQVRGEFFMMAQDEVGHSVYRINGSTAFRSPYKGYGKIKIISEELFLHVYNHNLTETFYSIDGYETQVEVKDVPGLMSEFRKAGLITEFFDAYNAINAFLDKRNSSFHFLTKPVFESLEKSVVIIKERCKGSPSRERKELKHMLTAITRKITTCPEEFMKSMGWAM